MKRLQILLWLSILFCASCASSSYLGNTGHSAFKRRDWLAAASAYESSAQKPGSNQLLFKLDQATALFNAGHYREAIDIFLEAEKIAEIKDYTSISEEVGVLATGQNVRGYKGEDYEKVLINVYLALSFAALGEIESAQVECRKINLLLNRMIDEGKRNYEESPFARYLAGLLWEASGNFNSAYVDYRLAHKLDPKLPGLGSSLIYASNKLGFRDDESRWRQEFPDVPLLKDKKGFGELILIYQQGQGPRKVPRFENPRLPRYVAQNGPDAVAEVIINGESVGSTERLLDIAGTSIRYLEDRIGRMAAARLAGTVSKAAIGYGVSKMTKNEDLGILAFLVLDAMDQADLRSWSTLPNSLHLKRVLLPEGEHRLELRILDLGGQELRRLDLGNVLIKDQKKVFRVAR